MHVRIWWGNVNGTDQLKYANVNGNGQGEDKIKLPLKPAMEVYRGRRGKGLHFL